MAGNYDQHLRKMRKIATPDPMRDSKPSPAPKKMSSQQMAEKLRSKMQPITTEKRRQKGIPWKLAASSFIGLVIALVGMTYLEKIEEFVKRLEIQVLAPAQAEGPKQTQEAKPQAEAKPVAAPETVKHDYTQDEINHFSRLNERKRELDAREEELNRMEAEIAKQKEELEKRLAELEQTRRGISSVLEERVKVDEKKVETLVQVYSNMKPQQAAKVFEAMDEDLAIEVLGRMKKKNAAEIMNLLKPEKAQVFSEKYAGYKRNVATEGGK